MTKLESRERRDELFRAFRRSAFHLELRDEYQVAYEDEPFRRWLNREPDDLAWFQPWLARVREATAAGKVMTRARVVAEPLSEYLRFEYAMTPHNLAAGEDVRWLPRCQAGGIDFPHTDYWLFDDEVVCFNHFTDEGRSAGVEIATEPEVVVHCRMVRDQVWSRAIPHCDYHPA